MTKYSRTSVDRKFDWDKNRGIIRREESKPVLERRNIGDCIICGMPVYVSPGQIIQYKTNMYGEKIFTHKSCRRENK